MSLVEQTKSTLATLKTKGLDAVAESLESASQIGSTGSEAADHLSQAVNQVLADGEVEDPDAIAALQDLSEALRKYIEE